MSTATPVDRRASTDRQIIVFGLGVLIVAALTVLLPDLTPPAGLGVVSDQAP